MDQERGRSRAIATDSVAARPNGRIAWSTVAAPDTSRSAEHAEAESEIEAGE